MAKKIRYYTEDNHRCPKESPLSIQRLTQGYRLLSEKEKETLMALLEAFLISKESSQIH